MTLHQKMDSKLEIKVADDKGAKLTSEVSPAVEIFRAGDQYWIERISNQEICVNGKMLAKGEKVSLRRGDEITFARLCCLWNIQDGAVKPGTSKESGTFLGSGRVPAWIRANFFTARATERIDPGLQPDDISRLLRPCIAAPHLHLFSGSAKEFTTELVPEHAEKLGTGLRWRVGRARNSSVLIDAEGISERHASIVCKQGKWRVTDELSQNGVFVNDKRVGVGFLSPGDRIRFGPVECVIHIPQTSLLASQNRWRIYMWAIIIGIAAALAVWFFFENLGKF